MGGTMYATVQDFVTRVGEKQAIELTDREFENAVNEAVLTVALSDSSSQIDGYLIGRYRLPLPSVPQNLTRLCCDLARYRLCSMTGVTITDEIIERYKLSLKELELIATGKIALGVVDDSASTDSVDNGVMFYNGENRIFNRTRKPTR